jgi:hypothetical protein
MANESIARATTLSSNYKYSLPTKRITTEAYDDDYVKSTGTTQDRTVLADAYNLAIGKIYNVTINETTTYNVPKKKGKDILYDANGDPITEEKSRYTPVVIPLTIRLMTSIVSIPNVVRILANKALDDGFIERYHQWRSGRISFIKDLILCQDLIDEYKRAAIADDTHTLVEIGNRINKSKAYAAVTKDISLADASNIFILSESAVRELEVKLGGKFSNHKVREKAFEATYAMIIGVVDREYEQVSFYIRGERLASTFTLKEIKSTAKNDNVNVLDILKSLQTHTPVSF